MLSRKPKSTQHQAQVCKDPALREAVIKLKIAFDEMVQFEEERRMKKMFKAKLKRSAMKSARLI